MKKWVQKELDTSGYDVLKAATGLDDLTCKLLVSRNIKTKEHADKFLKPNFSEDLHNPSLLKDIDIALKRLAKAIAQKQKVLVHTDYDADGVTTNDIYVTSLELAGLEVDYYLPNRFTDGYGVNIENVDKFAEYDLVITGDTGIREFKTIYELFKERGVDVIVTDHHEPLVVHETDTELIPENVQIIKQGEKIMVLPEALAVINPKRIDCDYPSKDLSGAAVAFKVMEALFEYLHLPKKQLYMMLDVVACGLIPDVVPTFDTKRGTFEVRNMIKLGLSIMNAQPKHWTSSIIDVKNEQKLKSNPTAKITARPITSTDIGYTYGPILNAVGRLYDPRPAAEFLLEKNYARAKELAEELIAINEERKEISRITTEEILKQIKEMEEPTLTDYGIVVESDKLHQGITGLVAGNILKEFYRTTIALARVEVKGEIVLKGSARSIPGVDVEKALQEVQRKFGKFTYGGHEQAAGLTIPASRFEEFRDLFRLAVKKQVDAMGELEVFEPKQYYDMEMTLAELNQKLVEELECIEPYGEGNQEPSFYCKDVYVEKLTPIGEAKQYAKFLLSQNGVTIEGVMFDKAKSTMKAYEKALEKNYRVPCEILAYPTLNNFNNRVQVQLMIREMKFED